LTPIGEAAGSKQLQRVRGTVGYQTDAGNDFKQVFAKFDLTDDLSAVTRASSAAVLAMPDSSLVSLGENTTIKASAFDNAAAAPGSTITVNGGSLRFDIRHPAGGAANYRFQTTTSAVGVRGTVGLLSFVNGVTTVGCLACAADDVTVTVLATGQTVSLVTGQVLIVSAAGVVTTAALSTAIAGFTTAGVPVTAESTAVAAGLPAGVAGSAITGAAAAAAIAGSVIGATATTGTATSQPAQPTSAPTQVPTPGATPTQSGTVNLTERARQLLARPTPSPTPAPAVRTAPPAVPGGPPQGRLGR
jgi:hypothetical protein